jgi:hypothetical protein
MILALLGSITLIKLMLILLIIATVRGMMTRARKTSCKSFARATSLGRCHNHILPLLGPLLTTWVHPEIRQIWEKPITGYGVDRT